MTSLIKNQDVEHFGYSLTLNSTYQQSNPNHVFEEKDYFFSEYEPSDQWWQVSFSKIVSINSYILKTSSAWADRPKSWVVYSSFDNKTWNIADAIFNIETGDNMNKIYPTKNIVCKHFRIVLKENWANKNAFLFSFFDCFGKIINRINQCTCDKSTSRHSPIITLMIYCVLIYS